ncbi:metal-dependent hydrolase [Natronorubrum sp. JWXQ-INN-674]|uniref:Metal-dependent hydrolase n=1 Tax=Natronorubrum halalkaliphilum TaxID=2691917 RepID=A0A6B0VI89_9EURY|nr:metal-dependent hydrolase [Natronorubrum halalkaliphilum]MXV60993.1 metal-dependent hydrolase [Natronorubrum halalkaliphilum]
MPDLLTHVLVGYIIGTLLSIRYERLRPAHVTLVMIGALSPDFVKIQLLIPDGLASALLGVPFSWSPLHTLGGSVLVIALGSLLLAPEYRAQAIVLFAIGALSHHVLDVLLMTPTGEAYAVFWPLTEYRPPAGGLFLSSDRWPAAVAGLGAALVWAVARYSEGATGTDSSTID